jgi:hypothetical protein
MARKRSSDSSVSSLSAPEVPPDSIFRNALTDDWFTVHSLKSVAKSGVRPLDGERAVLVLRIENGRFVELWSHHYDQEKMNRAWS